MEQRASSRLAGVSEISISTSDGGAFRASILDVSSTGTLVEYLPLGTALPLGAKVAFQFVLPTGEVRGTAEVVRVEPGKVALHHLTIDNVGGTANLADFLHSELVGVD